MGSLPLQSLSNTSLCTNTSGVVTSSACWPAVGADERQLCLWPGGRGSGLVPVTSVPGQQHTGQPFPDFTAGMECTSLPRCRDQPPLFTLSLISPSSLATSQYLLNLQSLSLPLPQSTSSLPTTALPKVSLSPL